MKLSRRIGPAGPVLLLLLGACGPRPSPLTDLTGVDRIEIVEGDLPTRVTKDSARLATILEIAKRPADWHDVQFTPPSSGHGVVLYSGDREVGVIHFGPTFLMVRTPQGSRIQTLDSATYARLLRATRGWPPRFEDYPATDTLTGPAAPIDYAFDPDIRRFRSQVENARAEPADLGGHFRFVVWGCGTQCTSHVILDLRTGRTYDDTLVNFSCADIAHRRESGLVVSAADTLLDRDDPCRKLQTHYFAWDHDRLVELHPDTTSIVPPPGNPRP